MSGNIQQQLYTRERGGIFSTSDGYDTIAISDGLDKSFVKKYLHPFCLYSAPKSLMASKQKDASLYPEAVTLFQPETGDLVIGQAVYVPADFTGERSTYFMHNYVIPASMKEEWLKNSTNLFQITEFATSYDVELGKVIPEKDAIGHGQRDILALKDVLLGRSGISEAQFKQLLFAVLTSIAGKKKVFISLPTPLEDYSKDALQLLELIYVYLPYAHRRRLGAMTFTSEPETKNYIHVMFFEPGTLNYADRSIEKQFIFDFAAGRISGVEIEGQKHEYLDLAMEAFAHSERINHFMTFAEGALSGLPDEQKLELSSYYQLTDLYLTLVDSDASIYQRNKIGFLYSLEKFLRVNHENKPDLVALFLKLISEEKSATDPAIVLDYVHSVLEINKIVRHEEPLSFVLRTLSAHQTTPLFQKLWKLLEQDKPSHRAIVLFIKERHEYESLLGQYLEERFQPLVRVEEILNEIKALLAALYLLDIEKFKSVAIEKLEASIKLNRNPFKAVEAVKEFSLNVQEPELASFKQTMLVKAMIVLLNNIRPDALSTQDIMAFGRIFTNISFKDMKEGPAKDRFRITEVLYQLLSNPSQAEFVNLKALKRGEREQVREIVQRLLRTKITTEQLPLLTMAYQSEFDDVDYGGLFRHLVQYGDDKAMLSFIRTNSRPSGMNQQLFQRTLVNYLVNNEKSIWKKKEYRNELKQIKSLRSIIKKVEWETANPVVKFLKQHGIKLGIAFVILGGVGSATWFGLDYLLNKDEKPKVAKTGGKATEKKKQEKPAPTEPAVFGLNSEIFKKWTPGVDGDQTIELRYPDQQYKFTFGPKQPRGALIDDKGNPHKLSLNVQSETSPFEQNDALKKGFSIYAAPYDFNEDKTDELVITATGGTEGSYIWVYRFQALVKEGNHPLELLSFKQSSADVKLQGNSLIIQNGEKPETHLYPFPAKETNN
ncbi:hypothetical protein [Neobacillus niacini]|uniref:GAP1-N2 domain-containing protein n=1 Tax=Neobacillus niacini TaxID=86668 RepID=UPI0021CB7BD1|nr:hypothetical protein [Neobacillus niacini]MCM3763536.1 hypothetical protein [Neobacillus niacini]